MASLKDMQQVFILLLVGCLQRKPGHQIGFGSNYVAGCLQHYGSVQDGHFRPQVQQSNFRLPAMRYWIPLSCVFFCYCHVSEQQELMIAFEGGADAQHLVYAERECACTGMIAIVGCILRFNNHV